MAFCSVEQLNITGTSWVFGLVFMWRKLRPGYFWTFQQDHDPKHFWKAMKTCPRRSPRRFRNGRLNGVWFKPHRDILWDLTMIVTACKPQNKWTERLYLFDRILMSWFTFWLYSWQKFVIYYTSHYIVRNALVFYNTFARSWCLAVHHLHWLLVYIYLLY